MEIKTKGRWLIPIAIETGGGNRATCGGKELVLFIAAVLFSGVSRKNFLVMECAVKTPPGQK